ncbi:MAG: zinc-dependent metalloprotease [Bacteroidia bacterium]|nr:zinc-dependent metalloprotease [Bacteroidia bacterium]
MRFLLPLLLMCGILLSCHHNKKTAALAPDTSIAAKTSGMVAMRGFFPVYHDTTAGKLYLVVDKWEEEFLYVNALRTGLGSNDIGLDRGQLGDHRIVSFVRRGPKVMLLQPNYSYRANSPDAAERASTQEAFAVSVLAGFDIIASENGAALIDLTPFLLRDAHGVADRLHQARQGSYSLDLSRSAIDPFWTRNFPENSEFDAMLTFEGKPEGGYVRSVVPSPDAITCWQHHSFAKLPDDEYKPRSFDPRSGFITISYQDYATPIDQPLVKRLILRHRLKKRNPEASQSEPLEPIIYYLDPGTPEPIRSALLEGASWWNQAFEAAGYINAFRVEMLPEYADPLDLRYNVIQWVHRSTRGWSYGSSVYDPRTGEIIKGHVSLGSLRVRQDFLIAQGLLDAYPEDADPSPGMKQLALARLRQLAAHEVGHTLGLMHNYAASTNDRASVMDYPSPLIEINELGELRFSRAYDVGIGEWDKRAILYGYQDFEEGVNEESALLAILAETQAQGLDFLTDADARPQGSASPIAHLWDNGSNAVTELHRMMDLRRIGLSRFGRNQIAQNMPLAELEEVLVPLYFAHRYQIEAAAKVLGGMDYRHAIRDSNQYANQIVPAADQTVALEALLRTLDPQELLIPESVLILIPPRASGYGRPRETMPGRTMFTLDPLSTAESLADLTIGLMLNPARLSRMVEFHARNNEYPGVRQVLDALWESTWKTHPLDSYQAEIARTVQTRLWMNLLHTASDEASHPQVRATALAFLSEKVGELKKDPWFARDELWWAQRGYAMYLWEQFLADPATFEPQPAAPLPDGSPIGMDACGG